MIPELKRPALAKLSIVVPCFNEEEVLPTTCSRLREVLNRLISEEIVSDRSNLIFVDDGSDDQTWRLIASYAGKHGEINGIKLSKNQGHQNALLAGIFSAKGDVVVTVDADLQDDLDAIFEMMKNYYSGSEVVYGVREERDSDSLFKRWTAENYYKLLRSLGVDLSLIHI